MEKKRQQDIKKTTRKTYSKIALQDNNPGSYCCAPGCCSGNIPAQTATAVGYDTSELESVPQASILGVGYGALVKSADLQKGEKVVDLESGSGIDMFLSANRAGKIGYRVVIKAVKR
jgi:hypothetical protein